MYGKICTFALNKQHNSIKLRMQNINSNIDDMLSKNVLLIDADFASIVAKDFSNNFANVLSRQIPPADLALWLDCLALDGGITPGENDIQVIFIHSSSAMNGFVPSDFKNEIDGKAFKDNLGEFSLEAYPTESNVASVGNQFCDTLQVLLDAKKVERLMVVGDTEQYGKDVLDVLAKNEDKGVSLMTIRPVEGKGFVNIQLGFSLLHALGISAEELN